MHDGLMSHFELGQHKIFVFLVAPCRRLLDSALSFSWYRILSIQDALGLDPKFVQL